MQLRTQSFFIVASIMIFVTSDSYSQPAIQWAECYGGTGDDKAHSIDKGWGGGYVIAGSQYSCQHGQHDMSVIKVDNSGNVSWSKCYGGGGVDIAYSILRIKGETDSGYIVAGTTLSNDGDVTGNHGFHDVWVIKTDASGNLMWQKTLGGSANDVAWSIKQTRDGGFIVASETESNDGDVSGNHGMRDYWIVKLDKTGNIMWEKAYGGSLDEYPLSIDVTNDGGFIVAGSATSSDGDVSSILGMADYWLVKLDSVGTIQWEKSYSGFGIDYATSVVQTKDSGYVISGQSSYNPNNDGKFHSVIKIDKYGAIQWSAKPGRTLDAIQTTSGDYVSIHSDTSGYVVNKMNNNGIQSWSKSMGGSVGEVPEDILQTDDGGYAIAGYTGSNDGDVTGNHGSWDFWVVKLAPDLTEVRALETGGAIRLYPNPAGNEIHFSKKVNVRLLSISGQLLDEQENVDGLNISSHAAGLYFAVFYNKSGQIIQSAKLVKE